MPSYGIMSDRVKFGYGRNTTRRSADFVARRGRDKALRRPNAGG
jgi:hypothetical protein